MALAIRSSSSLVTSSRFAIASWHGWHQIMFNNASRDTLIEDCVFHDMSTHAIYFGWMNYLNPYGAADFDFADNAAQYAAGQTTYLASARATIRNNVFYNNGSGGYETIHVNCYIDTLLIDSNIISYGWGHRIANGCLPRGNQEQRHFRQRALHYHPVALQADGSAVPATIRWVTIENNTLWQGAYTDSIRGTNPDYDITANDYSTEVGHWIKDVTVRNNVIVSDLLRQYPVPNGTSTPTPGRSRTTSSGIIALAPAARTHWLSSRRQPTRTAVTLGRTHSRRRVRTCSRGPGMCWLTQIFQPLLAHADPWLFNFDLSGNSPAIKAGTTGTAVVDIRGNCAGRRQTLGPTRGALPLARPRVS